MIKKLILDMKSVLFILPSLGSGGAERQAVTIACLLKKAGYKVSFWCYFDFRFYEPLLTKEGVPVTIEKGSYLKRILNAITFIRRGHYDVVISFMHTPNFLNDLAASFGKKWKVITSIRINPTDRMFSTKQGKIYAWFQRWSDVIVCNAEDSMNNYARFQPRDKSKLATIYNAVTLRATDSEYVIRRNNKTNIVVAATIDQRKNPRALLSALEMMSETEKSRIHIDWYGKKEGVIGNHEEYDKVISEIERTALNDIISFNDATDDIANRMKESDCVALFSSLEGLPNAICEGMMIGKPIIMSRVSDYWNLVEEDVNGFLCDWDDINSIKESLVRMINVSNEKLLSMGQESKTKAKVLFSQEVILKKWINIIEN